MAPGIDCVQNRTQIFPITLIALAGVTGGGWGGVPNPNPLPRFPVMFKYLYVMAPLRVTWAPQTPCSQNQVDHLPLHACLSLQILNSGTSIHVVIQARTLGVILDFFPSSSLLISTSHYTILVWRLQCSATILFNSGLPVLKLSWLMCVQSCFSHGPLFVTPWTIACRSPLPTEFCRQEYWSG